MIHAEIILFSFICKKTTPLEIVSLRSRVFFMILYPTETLYALGVNALDPEELERLYILKERDRSKTSSWLVRSMEDVERYAHIPPFAQRIAEQYLPGSLTLILKARDFVSDAVLASDRTVGFRISSDPYAQSLITSFMAEHDAPLTCTSANQSGAPTLPTIGEILQQLGSRARMVSKIIDDGPRKGLASTIVRVVGNDVSVLREGDISEKDIVALLR